MQSKTLGMTEHKSGFGSKALVFPGRAAESKLTIMNLEKGNKKGMTRISRSSWVTHFSKLGMGIALLLSFKRLFFVEKR